jgi:hypothetical protein
MKQRILLHEHHLVLRPGMPGGFRGEPLRVAYRDIADVSIVESFEAKRPSLTLRLVDGTTLAVPFARREMLKWRTLRDRAKRRSRAVRAAGDGDLDSAGSR